MNRSLCLALLASSVLASCASVSTNGTSTVAAAGTYYCWSGRLYEDAGQLVCNWENSPSKACESRNNARIAQTSVTKAPERASRCASGEWLVAVTTR